MKEKKAFLREKFITFQKKIASLGHALRQQGDAFQQRESSLCMGIFEILDALENIEESVGAREDKFDKTSRRLTQNIRSVHKKLIRLLKTNDIVMMEFPDNMARMESCKVVETEESNSLKDETIITVVKNGYMRKDNGEVLRKAEVITVLNKSGEGIMGSRSPLPWQDPLE
ncbi:MAG: nucleotide exchange factor GrpE [Desulfobacteraceae bacterium]|nr:nucleotide exchange factor GrpE [Desulfobacteraceae bacterium]